MSHELIFYRTPRGERRIEVIYQDENFWMSQKALAELFGVPRPAITKHLKNIFASEELAENAVCSILKRTAKDGKPCSIKYDNLDAMNIDFYEEVCA